MGEKLGLSVPSAVCNSKGNNVFFLFFCLDTPQSPTEPEPDCTLSAVEKKVKMNKKSNHKRRLIQLCRRFAGGEAKGSHKGNEKVVTCCGVGKLWRKGSLDWLLFILYQACKGRAERMEDGKRADRRRGGGRARMKVLILAGTKQVQP